MPDNAHEPGNAGLYSRDYSTGYPAIVLTMPQATAPLILATTGPESSGKTTLARDLAANLKAPLVLEASRDYLHDLYACRPGTSYRQQDLLRIAQLQLERERLALQARPACLVCDTDLLVIVVWSEVKYGHAEPALLDLFQQSLQQAPRHYLLCTPDIPWEPDPLREHPTQRAELFDRYQARLKQLALPRTTVQGNAARRLQQALDACKGAR